MVLGNIVMYGLNANSRNAMSGRTVLAFPALLLAAGLVAGPVASCARNPVTGKNELALVSEEQEIQMGQQAAQQVAQTIGFVDDPELQSYVAGIGKRMAAKSERPDLPWEFHVVNDAAVNAAAEQLLADLRATGIDAVLDDRGLRPGAMFADIELIGIPHRVVVSERGLAAGTFEYRARRADEAENIGREALLARLRG